MRPGRFMSAAFLTGHAGGRAGNDAMFLCSPSGSIYSAAEKEHRNSARTNEIRIPRKMAARGAIVTDRKRPATCLEVHGHAIPSIYLFRNNNGSAHPECANRVRGFGPFRCLLLMRRDKQRRTGCKVYGKRCYV